MILHDEAAKRFDILATEIGSEIQVFERKTVAQSGEVDLHISHTFTENQIISVPSVQFLISQIGEACGIIWESQGKLVGWQGKAFQKILDLARAMIQKASVRELISEAYALDQIGFWLFEHLEKGRRDSLSAFFLGQCEQAIKDFEIWTPMFRTYSNGEFSIGDVTFRTISKAMVDVWQNGFQNAYLTALK